MLLYENTWIKYDQVFSDRQTHHTWKLKYKGRLYFKPMSLMPFDP